MLAVAVLACFGTMAMAQNSPTADTAQTVAVSAPAPQLAYGVPEILQLAQAKVGDDTIIAYIKNSGNSYGLSADQIIYLRQQGVSDAVIKVMLNQPKPAAVASAPPAPQPAAAPASPQPVSTATVAPTVTYVQTAPAPAYYYYQPYYYPVYGGIYPAVSFSFGWGGGYGRGWHGGGWRH